MQTQGILPMILPVHILAGGLALVFGYVALSAAKGGTLHRKNVSTPLATAIEARASL